MASNQQQIMVIGAGMGGLCAAIRLAVAGMRVTVVETQSYPGGKMRTMPSDAGAIDAGPTVLTLRAVFDEVFALVGERLDDHITLIAQPLLARHWWPDGSRLDLFADPDQNREAINRFAGPVAAAEFARFDAEASRLYSAFDAPMMQARRPELGKIALNALVEPALWPVLRPGRCLSQYLAHRFTDPRLRQLFGRYATYVGGAPHLSPAVLALIWHAEARGVWAVQGGMHLLAQALAALATRLGVTLRFGISARKILRKAGRVSAVVLSDGQAAPCDAVVFNGDPAALLAGLLGNGEQFCLPQAAVHPRSLSAWVWSFAAKPAPFELVHHNVFFGSDPALEFGPLQQGRMPEDPTLYVCAQDRAGAAFVPGRAERFEIIMNAPAKSTQSIHEISECRAKTFPTLARFGLTFDPAPADQALTTPQGFSALFPGSQGAIYGRSPQGMMASFQRPGSRTQMQGLYLAGGGAHPGAGVPMAALSGKHAAEAILNDLTSAPTWPQTAMRGGMSIVSRLTGRALFR